MSEKAREKAIVFQAYNGLEIIDTRPEAEIAYSQMEYAEERYKRNKRRKRKKKNESLLASLF